MSEASRYANEARREFDRLAETDLRAAWRFWTKAVQEAPEEALPLMAEYAEAMIIETIVRTGMNPDRLLGEE